MAFREMMPWKKHHLSREHQEEHPFYTLQRDMNRMMERFNRRFGFGDLPSADELWSGFSPTVDVSENDHEIRVTAELPGIDEKDLDLSISAGNLVIRGEKKTEKEEKEEQYYHKESSYGAFHRVIPLPAEVDEDKIEATYRKGVLKIKLPKSAEAKQERKKIEIH